MSRSKGGSGDPQAIIHRRILDVAEANPDASLEAIADQVTAASIDLVDRVLEEYGDPGDGSDELPGDQLERQSDTEDGTGECMSDAETTQEATVETSEKKEETADTEGESPQVPDRSDLSEKQLDALRLIRERPEATQREMAKELDVTAATVSRWLNDIPGFEWDRRERFVSRTLNGDTTNTASADEPAAEPGASNSGDDSGASGTDPIEDLRERVAALERETDRSCENGPGAVLDPDLLHKVIHACMASEHVTEEEELRILDGLVGEGS